MSNPILEQKAKARRRLRALVAAMTAAERAEASVQLQGKLRDSRIWQDAGVVLFYHPLADEPDVWPLLEERLAQGRTVALPRFEPSQAAYRVCRVEAAERDLGRGRFGILEPGKHCPEVDAKHLDLILVPGIGFSLDGVRLGRGKGYYDRLLSGVSGFRCGVAFECQLLDELPVEPHDIRLNGILTPTRWLPMGSCARF